MNKEVTAKDLELFFGDNAQPYVAHWEYKNQKGKRTFRENFRHNAHWPAFFLGPIWMCYRKLYLFAIAVILGIYVFDFAVEWLLNHEINFAVYMLLYGWIAKPLAVWNAKSEIQDINKKKLTAKEREQQIREAGGTSTIGAVIMAVVSIAYVVTFGLILYFDSF